MAGFGLVFGPAAVGDGSMAGAGHWAEVAESGLTRRPAVVDWYIAFGVVEVHFWTEAASEGEDVGYLLGSDGGSESLRHLIAVDGRYRVDQYGGFGPDIGCGPGTARVPRG